MLDLKLLRILIVDDDEDDYIIIRDILSEVTEVQYQIEWADNYSLGLQLLTEKTYDACLLDYRLGKHSGMELLREIVNAKYRMPVILLTGLKDHEIDVEAMNSGAADFLVKGEVNSVILERSIRYSIERKKMEEELYNEKERALVTLDSIGDSVITSDIEGKITYLNHIAEQITGWSMEDAQGLMLSTVFKVLNENTMEVFPDLIKTVVEENRIVDFSHQALFVNHQGQNYAIEGTASPIRDREDRIIGIVLVFRDVTNTREMSKKISYQANHDSLTGLINRAKFEELLREAVDSSANFNIRHCLLYMDLDRFKIVNDTCGHMAGDQLLIQVTNLIQEKIRRTDVFGRMGGDEFAILLENCPVPKACEIASFICEAIQGYHFIWQNYQFTVGISIGVVEINAESPNNIDRIVTCADEACYRAKDNGGNGYHCYQLDNVGTSSRENEMLWVLNINHAFSENLFRLYFQPIVPVMSKNQSVHYELLIRMLDEQGQIVAPNNFLPIATRYRLMSAIDRWVVNHYFSFYQEQLSKHPELNSFICNINLSGSFLNEETSLRYLEEQIAQYQIPPEHICFEITETSAIANFNQAIEFIERLRSLGCQFALDDFGNGLATFNYLKNLPVDYVKIDGSFVRNILLNRIDCAMVESINQIAHLMKIKTVAEFVENEAIFEKLGAIGIDYAQGYWNGKPQPLESLLSLI
ncbi:MAG TPA: EAL domain-containing protein [Bacillota bacterium]|nr:EAL domain-containing protein [Bacillota bacterium]